MISSYIYIIENAMVVLLSHLKYYINPQDTLEGQQYGKLFTPLYQIQSKSKDTEFSGEILAKDFLANFGSTLTTLANNTFEKKPNFVDRAVTQIRDILTMKH